ncbi:MAG: ribosome maturation factor RimP [Coriobacteriales bacterium]|nr:ribosome maturation factor RimP [Coriobacteriales bacterium]
MANKREKLIVLLEDEAQKYGLDLCDIEIAGTKKNPILRVYLDTLDDELISLDQLAEAHAWVDQIIDDFDPFETSYVLEVSSPGIDRPLRKLSDFNRFAGEDLVIHYKSDTKRKKLNGILCGTRGSNIVVKSDDEEIEIDFAFLVKANIIGKIDFN